MDTVFSILAVLLGIFCFYTGIKGLIKLANAKNYVSCETTVTDIDVTTSVSKGRRYTHYSPIVAYQVQNEHYEEKYDQSSSTCKYQVGDTIDIAYNPAKPADFIIDGDRSIIWNSLLMLAMGCLMFFVVIKIWM